MNSSPPNNASTHTPARGSLFTGEEKAIRLTPPRRSLASESSATTVAPTPRFAGRIPTAVSATCLPVTAAVAAMPKSSRTPSRICVSAGTSVAVAFAKDPQGPQAVPKLQLQFCKHPEELASGGFQGFPLSRRAESTRADGHVPGAADADDVILAMPPSVTGTPTSLTPGRGTSGGGSDVPVPIGNLSPGLSHVVSQSLGNGFIGQNNRCAEVQKRGIDGKGMETKGMIMSKGLVYGPNPGWHLLCVPDHVLSFACLVRSPGQQLLLVVSLVSLRQWLYHVPAQGPVLTSRSLPQQLTPAPRMLVSVLVGMA